jgi:hypothetical protein
MKLLAFEQPLSNAATQLGIAEILENKNTFIEAPKLSHGSVEMVARTAGQQPFERHRGGTLSGSKRGKELTDAIPVRRDPIEM